MEFLNFLAASPTAPLRELGEESPIAAYFVILGATIISYLVISFFYYKIFKKAGRPGWAGFVPFYNLYVWFEIGGKPGYLAILLLVLCFIPLLGFIASIALAVVQLIVSLEIAKRFGKGPLFGVFGLWLFSIIGYAILAFDDSKYQVIGASVTPADQTTPQPIVPPSNNSTPPQNPPTTPPNNL